MAKMSVAAGAEPSTSAEVGSSANVKSTRAKRTFAPKPGARPEEDLRAVFDDTCIRYPKTLARLGE